MRARKIDANQNRIVKQLRSIPGVSVRITSMVGEGFVDIIIGFRRSNYFIELKDPAKPPSQRKLTEVERKFRDQWTGQYNVCETLEEIMGVVGLQRAEK